MRISGDWEERLMEVVFLSSTSSCQLAFVPRSLSSSLSSHGSPHDIASYNFRSGAHMFLVFSFRVILVWG